jgi:hypothetical protein
MTSRASWRRRRSIAEAQSVNRMNRIRIHAYLWNDKKPCEHGEDPMDAKQYGSWLTPAGHNITEQE